MKAKLLLLFCLIVFISKAQTYSISPANTVTFTAPFYNITINDIFQVNTASTKILLKWELVSINVPAGWGYSMCDLGTCYPGIPAGPSAMDSVPVGDKGFLGLNIDPVNIAGTGVVKVFVYQDGFKPNGDTLTWHINTPAVSVEEISGNSGIKIYPNPASDKLNVDLNGFEATGVTLTDALGRTVINNIPLSPGLNSIDFSVLPQGFYMVNINTSEKRLFKRIIKE